MQVPPELNLVNGLNNLEEKLAPQSKIKSNRGSGNN